MIYAEKFSEVEANLRRIVDEMMRHELNLLQVSASCVISSKILTKDRKVTQINSLLFRTADRSGQGSRCQRQKG